MIYFYLLQCWNVRNVPKLGKPGLDRIITRVCRYKNGDPLNGNKNKIKISFG